MKAITSLVLTIFITVSPLANDSPSLKDKIVEKVNYAAKTNNIKLIKEYINLGGDLNIQDQKGYTPLIFAAYYGHEDIVQVLLKNKANPCLKDNRGNTALMGAIFKGNIKISYELMKAECSKTQRNNEDQSPLMYAALFNRTEIVKRLLKEGQSPLEIDKSGRSALKLAKDQYNKEMIELLNSHTKKK